MSRCGELQPLSVVKFSCSKLAPNELDMLELDCVSEEIQLRSIAAWLILLSSMSLSVTSISSVSDSSAMSLWLSWFNCSLK